MHLPDDETSWVRVFLDDRTRQVEGHSKLVDFPDAVHRQEAA
jgi:hypothetical protein